MKDKSIDASLKKLSEIAEWFDSQEEADVEQGLDKVKEASELIKFSKSRLQEIENEFVEIKKEIDPQLNDEKIVVEESETVQIKISEDNDEMPF